MTTDQFSKLIYDRRQELKMTQSELADAVHVTRQAVSKWETGKSLPDIGLICMLSDVLDLPVARLIDDHADEKQQQIIDKEVSYQVAVRLSEFYRKQTDLRRRSMIRTSLLLIISILLSLFFFLMPPFLLQYTSGAIPEYLLYYLPFVNSILGIFTAVYAIWQGKNTYSYLFLLVPSSLFILHPVLCFHHLYPWDGLNLMYIKIILEKILHRINLLH